MDRQTAMERQREFALNALCREMMDEIFEPGKKLDWGVLKHPDLIAKVATLLALEYQSLTGAPVLEWLQGDPVLNISKDQPMTGSEGPLPDDAIPLG